jgi:hypothetical protein
MDKIYLKSLSKFSSIFFFFKLTTSLIENIGSSNQPPFSIFFTPSTIKSVQDENELRATAFDALGGHIEASGFFSTN